MDNLVIDFDSNFNILKVFRKLNILFNLQSNYVLKTGDYHEEIHNDSHFSIFNALSAK